MKKTAVTAVLQSGVPGGIRTRDLWRRRPTLYPAELRVQQITAVLIPPKKFKCYIFFKLHK